MTIEVGCLGIAGLVILLIDVCRIVLMLGLESHSLGIEQHAVVAVEHQCRVDHSYG